MEEKNKIIFQITYKNKPYSISTSITLDRINIECKDYYSQIFENNFTIQELMNISKYFQPNHTIYQIQQYINGIIEKQKIDINQGEEAISMILYLINNDQISIPLLKKLNPGYINTTNIPNISTKPLNINPPFTRYNSITPSNQLIISNIPQQKHNTFIKQVKQNNNNNNAINNEIKKLLDEIKKLKEENEVYKTDHGSLTNENAVLKTENDNIKKQMLVIQNENKILKDNILKLNKEIETYNKDMDAIDNQNNDIRKMYMELENEFNEYKKNNIKQESNKENEILRNQIDELNNNFIMINKELENIRNENEIFKNNLEQQKNNLNEDVVNKLIEENNILKQKVEENDFLKKQLEELQYQLQYQERQENQENNNNNININTNSEINNNNYNINESINDNDNDNDMDNRNNSSNDMEEKGEIIHNMKELELITNKINKENKKISLNLIYKASVNGDKASTFHERCDQAQNTIVLVETLNGKRFGGFTTQSWSGNCEDKNDSAAFVFSLDKMETYDNIPGDEAIGCYPKFGPIFLGCQIKIFDNAFTKGGTTFEKELNFNTKEDYELTGGERIFQIKEVEVYEVIFE